MYKKKITGVYNIGSGKSISIKTLLKKKLIQGLRILFQMTELIL